MSYLQNFTNTKKTLYMRDVEEFPVGHKINIKSLQR